MHFQSIPGLPIPLRLGLGLQLLRSALLGGGLSLVGVCFLCLLPFVGFSAFSSPLPFLLSSPCCLDVRVRVQGQGKATALPVPFQVQSCVVRCLNLCFCRCSLHVWGGVRSPVLSPFRLALCACRLSFGFLPLPLGSLPIAVLGTRSVFLPSCFVSKGSPVLRLAFRLAASLLPSPRISRSFF